MKLIQKSYKNRLSLVILGFGYLFAGLVHILTLGFYTSNVITLMLLNDKLNTLEEWEDKKGI